nr:hypothetical protein [Fimbriiglobus ruber]
MSSCPASSRIKAQVSRSYRHGTRSNAMTSFLLSGLQATASAVNPKQLSCFTRRFDLPSQTLAFESRDVVTIKVPS